MVKIDETVLYQGRVVPIKHFRAFVFNQTGQKLVESYAEYQISINSKEWFSTKDEIPTLKPAKVKKNDPDSKRVCE